MTAVFVHGVPETPAVWDGLLALPGDPVPSDPREMLVDPPADLAAAAQKTGSSKQGKG